MNLSQSVRVVFTVVRNPNTAGVFTAFSEIADALEKLSRWTGLPVVFAERYTRFALVDARDFKLKAEEMAGGVVELTFNGVVRRLFDLFSVLHAEPTADGFRGFGLIGMVREIESTVPTTWADIARAYEMYKTIREIADGYGVS